MIYYFSGTGNSKWTAESLALKTNDSAISIIDCKNKITVNSGETVGFVFPIYAWDTPKIMLDFIKKVDVSDNAYVFIVCTCGENCGNAIEKLQKSFKIDSAYTLVMPNNYVVGSNIEDESLINAKIENAKIKLEEIAENINIKAPVFNIIKGKIAFIKTAIVAPAFNKFALSDKPFTVSENCISCNKCECVCPVSNIKMIDGKPQWQGHCIKCLACINYCPTKAINFGEVTKNRGRYYFKDII